MTSRKVIARQLLECYADEAVVHPASRWLDVQADRVVSVLHGLAKPGSLVLGDPVGTGKTAIALVAAVLMLERDVRYCLVIAPNELVAKLWAERARYLRPDNVRPSPEGRRARFSQGNIVVATRQEIPRSLSQLQEPARTLIVIDEAHRGFQNEHGASFTEVREISPGTRILLVTATPFQLSPKGLATMLSLHIYPGDGDGDGEAIKAYGAALTRVLHRCDASSQVADGAKQACGKSVQEALHAKAKGEKALLRHCVLPHPQYGKIPKVQVPERTLVKLRSWAVPYHVARIVPELVGLGKGDMFQRRLVSSSEAFLNGKAGTLFAEQCLERHATDLFDELSSRLGSGTDHPKIRTTAEWVGRRWRSRRHVVVFCVFQETQQALQKAISAVVGDENVATPTQYVSTEHTDRFRRPPGPRSALVLVLRDNLSESIDLDGGDPCIVHHDLSWNPMRLVQRWGRVVRLPTGFKPVALEDIFIPVLDTETDRRLYDTVRARLAHAGLFLPGGARVEDDSFWEDLPACVVERLGGGS